MPTGRLAGRRELRVTRKSTRGESRRRKAAADGLLRAADDVEGGARARAFRQIRVYMRPARLRSGVSCSRCLHRAEGKGYSVVG